MARKVEGQWSYSGNPRDSRKDSVRFLIGDTDARQKQLSDDEIEYHLDVQSSILEAAICCVQGLIALYARDFDDSMKTKSAQVTANYREMLKMLVAKRSQNINLIYAGGLTESDKKQDETNRDMVKPMFSRKLGDNHRDGNEFQ